MEKLKSVLKYLIFLAIGVALFYYVYRGIDLEALKGELKNIKWGWVWLSFGLAFLSHISRAIRWNMLIETMDHKPRLINTVFSIFIMYASNFVVTRSGELARCTVISKYDKVPFGKLVGTVVVERATDTLFLMIIMFVTIILQFSVFNTFLDNNPAIRSKIGFVLSPWFWLTLIALGITFLWSVWKYRHLLRKIQAINKLFDLLFNFFTGIKSIKNLKNPGWYLFHSAFIYIMYFLMTYVVFFSFAPTSNVTVLAGFTTFIMGGLAMLAPVQGGIGAWHFMVIETLALYGIDKTNGKIFALISHTSMSLMLLVVGALCFITIPLVNRTKK